MRVTIYQCPVDGCDWELQPESLPAARVLVGGATLEEALAASASASAKTMEAVLRDHLAVHDVLDFLRTIQRLNQHLAQFDSGIRPHVYREEWTGKLAARAGREWKP